MTKQHTSCSSLPTDVPLIATKWKWPIQQQPSATAYQSMASSNMPHQHSWKGEMMNLWFSSPSLAGTLLKGLAGRLNYKAMPSWEAVIQTLIPRNFHTLVCTLTSLMFTITYVGIFPFPWGSETQERISGMEDGGTLATKGTIHGRGEELHLHIIISDMIIVIFRIIPFLQK